MTQQPTTEAPSTPKFTIRTLTGQQLTEVNGSITVRELKELLEKDHNMPGPEGQKLVLKGTVLDDMDKSLIDYSPEPTFVIVMKQKAKPVPKPQVELTPTQESSKPV